MVFWLVLAGLKKSKAQASTSNREATITALRKIRGCAAHHQADMSVVSTVLEPAMAPSKD